MTLAAGSFRRRSRQLRRRMRLHQQRPHPRQRRLEVSQAQFQPQRPHCLTFERRFRLQRKGKNQRKNRPGSYHRNKAQMGSPCCCRSYRRARPRRCRCPCRWPGQQARRPLRRRRSPHTCRRRSRWRRFRLDQRSPGSSRLRSRSRSPRSPSRFSGSQQRSWCRGRISVCCSPSGGAW